MVGIGIIKKDEFNLGLKNGLVQIGRKCLKGRRAILLGAGKTYGRNSPLSEVSGDMSVFLEHGLEGQELDLSKIMNAESSGH